MTGSSGVTRNRVTSFTGVVRPARPGDYARMAELAGQLTYPSVTEDIARRMGGLEGSKEHAVFVAETEGGEVAGWIGLFVLRSVEADARVEIAGLIVDERFRSQGVGEKLIERAERWARERNCREIGLRSNLIRDRAHKFYERLGYRNVKTQKSFRKQL